MVDGQANIDECCNRESKLIDQQCQSPSYYFHLCELIPVSAVLENSRSGHEGFV